MPSDKSTKQRADRIAERVVDEFTLDYDPNWLVIEHDALIELIQEEYRFAVPKAEEYADRVLQRFDARRHPRDGTVLWVGPVAQREYLFDADDAVDGETYGPCVECGRSALPKHGRFVCPRHANVDAKNANGGEP